MPAIRSTLVLLLLALASTAHAQAPWSVSPFEGFGIEPAEQARLAALAPVPDLLEPLWARTSSESLVTSVFGAPDLTGRRATWKFDVARITTHALSSATSLIEIERRKPDPLISRPLEVTPSALAPFVQAAMGTCSEAIARFGRPSFKERGSLVWLSSGGGGRDVAVLLACGRDGAADVVRDVRIVQSELTPEDHDVLVRGSQPAATLPRHFKQVVGKSRVDPLTLWPRGFAPGDSVIHMLAKVGVPSLMDTDHDYIELRWALVLAARVEEGRVRAVTMPAQGKAVFARMGVTSPLIPLLGKPLGALTELLGQPIARDEKYIWRWTAAGHELRVEAQVAAGLVSAIELEWTPATLPESLSCTALLSVAPSPAPKPIDFKSPLGNLTTPQLLPFKLWFGANRRDVVDRLGPPRGCMFDGDGLSFQGVFVSFGPTGLQSIEVDVDFLSAEHYASNDPLIAVLRKGKDALVAHIGGEFTADEGDARRFERGTQRALVSFEMTETRDGVPGTLWRYRVRGETGFDFDVITGLDLDHLPVEGRTALGLADVTVPNSAFDFALVLLAADKPTLVKAKVGGKLIDLLGGPWTAIVAALGLPTDTVAAEGRLLLIWRPDGPRGRKFAFVCSGAKPSCDELHINVSDE